MSSSTDMAEGPAAPTGPAAVTMRLVEQWGIARTAEFIDSLQQAVDGLSSNNKAFADAFQSAIEKQYQLESSLRELIQLANAVTVSESSGIDCGDVDGVNWFDRRQQLTAVDQ